MKRIKVTISGGFHNVSERSFLLELTEDGRVIGSARQLREIQKHECGFHDCTCGGRGVVWETPDNMVWTDTEVTGYDGGERCFGKVETI